MRLPGDEVTTPGALEPPLRCWRFFSAFDFGVRVVGDCGVPDAVLVLGDHLRDGLECPAGLLHRGDVGRLFRHRASLPVPAGRPQAGPRGSGGQSDGYAAGYASRGGRSGEPRGSERSVRRREGGPLVRRPGRHRPPAALQNTRASAGRALRSRTAHWGLNTRRRPGGHPQVFDTIQPRERLRRPVLLQAIPTTEPTGQYSSRDVSWQAPSDDDGPAFAGPSSGARISGVCLSAKWLPRTTPSWKRLFTPVRSISERRMLVTVRGLIPIRWAALASVCPAHSSEISLCSLGLSSSPQSRWSTGVSSGRAPIDPPLEPTSAVRVGDHTTPGRSPK